MFCLIFEEKYESFIEDILSCVGFSGNVSP